MSTHSTIAAQTAPLPPSNATPYPINRLSIKAWAEEDRPREKMQLLGRQSLSDAELIAILLGSGSRHESAVALAKRILKASDHNLHDLGKRSLKDLMRFKGIGEAKAIAIAAALELGRRRQLSDIKQRPQIRSSKDAAKVISALLQDLPHEEFWILLLNRANRVIGRERISSEGVSGTIVDARIIFKSAIEHTASGVILAHNHPSGNLNPSQADLKLTKRLKESGKLLDINILDHLIITDNGYYSMADEGVM